MWHYKGRWKYGPYQADMNTHADTTIPSRRMRSRGWRDVWQGYQLDSPLVKSPPPPPTQNKSLEFLNASYMYLASLVIIRVCIFLRSLILNLCRLKLLTDDGSIIEGLGTETRMMHTVNGWLVGCYVVLAIFQPYRDFEAGDNQSLKS